jgi:HD superfamily phosphohydrolase
VAEQKIFNDPVYGFVTVNDPLIQWLLDHPYFQRLGRISQLGLSYLVYPGAHHTRFHHALGAMHLMGEALEVLIQKGVSISKAEAQAARIAILLHDIGHGPFSHTLEKSIMPGVEHESISLEIMKDLNQQCNGKLDLAISIFTRSYHRTFLSELVSGQLDVDRLDYLMRDSFYTGVAEGIIGSERIIKMMNVVNNQLVVEQKGIYSVEKFLIARRLMYWQVYFHKTVVGAEALLTSILRRAKECCSNGDQLFCTSALRNFLYGSQKTDLKEFVQLDDMDILASIKEWVQHHDPILSDLCFRLIYRKLFRVKLQSNPFTTEEIEDIRSKVKNKFNLQDNNQVNYYVSNSFVSTLAYEETAEDVLIMDKKGGVSPLFQVSDHLLPEDMTRVITKHFVCYPKDIE